MLILDWAVVIALCWVVVMLWLKLRRLEEAHYKITAKIADLRVWIERVDGTLGMEAQGSLRHGDEIRALTARVNAMQDVIAPPAAVEDQPFEVTARRRRQR